MAADRENDVVTVRQVRLSTDPGITPRYLRSHRLGVGGMAEVIAARDTWTGQDVALKRALDPENLSVAERLRREAIAMAAVKSPHVVTLYDVQEHGRQTVLVMQLVRGRTIGEEVRARGPFSADRACRVAAGVLSGLASIHEAGFVHRDITPTNVMLGSVDFAVILDLGIALHQRHRRITPAGYFFGTPELMAPEALTGAYGQSSDVFQVSLLLAYMLTGIDFTIDRLPDEHALARVVPRSLARVITRGLAPARSRFPTAGAMQQAVRAAASPH